MTTEPSQNEEDDRSNDSGQASNLRTFVAFVDDQPGVLARVAALFRRRSYNIDSLAVGRTDVPGVSRATIVVETDAATARLVEANLYKLVNVLRVEDVTDEPTIMRDLALIKVRATAAQRPEVLGLIESFHARVVDVVREALVVEIAGTEERLERLIKVLRPFGIIEMVRTGSVAITRGAAGIPIDPTFVPARVPGSEGA